MASKAKSATESDVPKRNLKVEAAVTHIVAELDKLIEGEPVVTLAPKKIQIVFDAAIEKAKGSVRLANVFFIAYAIVCDDWDFDSIPVGIRGTHGDKKLAASLTDRFVNFHMSVTAFGENLGWKGAVRNFSLRTDGRFKTFVVALASLNAQERQQLFDHAIWVMYQSRAVPKALPKLPATYLTYARGLVLTEELVALQTEGHVQQFLVAAFLHVHRGRRGHTIKTHHPHAADKFDGTCGDIEEFHNEDLVAAYEVTVRDDWKNRLPDFRAKMLKGGLKKYVLIASNVHVDGQLSTAKKLLDFTKQIEFDLAIVDIKDFFAVFCAELSTDELLAAINLAYEFLLSPVLCGRQEIQQKFREVVDQWLEINSEAD